MTKKDYIIISRVFHTTAKIWMDARAKWITKMERLAHEAEPPRAEWEMIDEKIDGINKILASLDVIVKGLSHELKKDNPKFDAEKFAVACGLPRIKEGGNDEVVAKVAAGLED